MKNNTSKIKIRTRFAPSPTGFMHIGNLRSALYAYLFAKANDGAFVLRIEDTDQKRFVSGAVEVIYNTLKTAKMEHDEGPDVGGEFGPYTQSKRKNIYTKYANKLLESGFGYRCFCKDKQALNEKPSEHSAGYDRTCRNLTAQQIDENLKTNKPFVIRQKMPLTGETSYNDLVFGEIVVKNEVLEDHVLIKSDGMPTYNFANVIDDHLMQITHVIRGSEYIPSTPKYKLLYEAFGWDVPNFAHLPLIMGKDAEGNVSKLSKRFGATSFDELINEGYLPEAIINYIALLGWSPKGEEEIFSLDELSKMFRLEDVSKSPSIFDYKKLKWMNAEYIKKLNEQELSEKLKTFTKDFPESLLDKWDYLVFATKERLETLADFGVLANAFVDVVNYEAELLLNEKNKVHYIDAKNMLSLIQNELQNLPEWSESEIHKMLHKIKNDNNYKMGYVMWPARIAMSGKRSSPTASEFMFVVGEKETNNRINTAISKINEKLNNN